MPRDRRTYWLYPDLDSAEARRRNRRNNGTATQIGVDWDAYGVARTVHQPSEVRPRNHEQLHYQFKVSKDQANLVSSNVDGKEGMHMPCLDLDIPHKYVPSSTEGHGHLYLDVEVPEDKYFALLDLLGECGILEPGYVRASKAKGGTYLRPEGVKKKHPRKKKEAQPEPAPTREAEIAQGDWGSVTGRVSGRFAPITNEPVSEANIFHDSVVHTQPMTQAQVNELLYGSGEMEVPF